MIAAVIGLFMLSFFSLVGLGIFCYVDDKSREKPLSSIKSK